MSGAIMTYDDTAKGIFLRQGGVLGIDRQYIKRRKRWVLLVERTFVFLMNAGRSWFGHCRAAPDSSMVRSVLIIRHNQLGDAVASSPFIEAARNVWPNASVHVLASRSNAEAFSWVDGVDKVIVRPHALGARWMLYWRLRGRYDIVFQTLIDEHYLSRTLATRCIAGQGVCVGRKRGSPLEQLFDYSVYMPQGGYVGKLMAMLEPFCELSFLELIQRHPVHRLTLPGAAVKAVLSKLRFEGIEPRSYIALNISARVEFRKLGVDQAARLANFYISQGVPVVLLFAPDDEARARAISQQAPGVLAPKCASLAEAMAVAQHARLYLGADTGTAHFAAAGLTPCVVLSSFRARADNWSPYGVPFVSVQANPDQEVADIDDAVVLEYAGRILAGEPSSRIVKATPQRFSVGVAPVRAMSAA